MARKLPWAGSGPLGSTKAPNKRVSIEVVKKEEQQDVSWPATPGSIPRGSLKRATSRSPSSSPIRSPSHPIPHVEQMHEGLQADDKYIMVEDEFESVARQFTAHLHAAEYTRLKAKAKSAPPKTLPALSPSTSGTTKLNIERKQLLSRQSTTLSEIGKRGRAADLKSRHEDEVEDGDGALGDLWSGTSLAGLMGEGSQVKTSLMGVERLGHGTRASKGYGRGETESTPKKKRKTILDIFAEWDGEGDDLDSINKKQERLQGREHDQDRDDGTKDNTTARGTSNKPAAMPTKEPKDNNERLTTPKHNQKIEEHQPFQSKPEPRPRPSHISSNIKNRRGRIDDLDDLDPSRSDVSAPSSRTKAFTPFSSALERKQDVKKDRKSRLDEVPVFLV